MFLSAAAHVLMLSAAGMCFSHGFLLQPMGRSFLSYKFDPYETKNYNPQGANAGGGSSADAYAHPLWAHEPVHDW